MTVSVRGFDAEPFEEASVKSFALPSKWFGPESWLKLRQFKMVTRCQNKAASPVGFGLALERKGADAIRLSQDVSIPTARGCPTRYRIADMHARQAPNGATALVVIVPGFHAGRRRPEPFHPGDRPHPAGEYREGAMIPRYSRPEMAAIWSPETRFRIWFEIEAHAADAMAELGIIPKEAAKKVWEKGKSAKFDVARIDAIEAEVKHDVIAFLTHLSEIVGPEARFVHSGMTSSDVLDTCLECSARARGAITDRRCRPAAGRAQAPGL